LNQRPVSICGQTITTPPYAEGAISSLESSSKDDTHSKQETAEAATATPATTVAAAANFDRAAFSSRGDGPRGFSKRGYLQGLQSNCLLALRCRNHFNKFLT